MSEDEVLLRAILAQPDDKVSRLAYADWLEDRTDPRAEYLLLEAKLTGMSDAQGVGIRARLAELRTQLPSWWLAIVGGLHLASVKPDPARAELVAQKLGRPVRYVDGEGYEREITAAAVSGFTDSLAYVECRSQERENWLDIKFHLRIRASDGREVMCEPETYNPYFGCRVQLLEWFGDEVLMIYNEKHDTYICRFGLDSPIQFLAIKHHWVLNGPQLGYWGYEETAVHRITIPGLEQLPALSEIEASERELLPRKSW